MLARIKTFFDERLNPIDPEDTERSVQLAACTLLFEMVKADHQISARELESMRGAVKTVMEIDDSTADELIEMAEQEAEESTSLYQFTRLVNDHYSPEQKARLAEGLWMIAYADGKIDKYEEHYLRKLAGLLYIPHSIFIQTKLSAKK